MTFFDFLAQAQPQDPDPAAEAEECCAEEDARGDPRELAFYRDHTLALLYRYLRLSIDTGRLPSLLGREFFRARVSRYSAQTFEDAVIFVHDVEQCLQKLDAFSRELIARVVFQDHTEEEAARSLHRPLRTVERHFPRALDQVTELFLAGGILRPLIRPD